MCVPLQEAEALECAIDALTVTLTPYVPAEFPQNAVSPARDIPLSFPQGQDISDTGRLRVMMPIFIAQLFSMFSIEAVQRGAIARMWKIRQALRGLYRAERQNFDAAITSAMQANPVWQSRVRHDLGGEKALTAWEARQVKLQQGSECEKPGKPQTSSNIPKSAGRKSNALKAKILTDRTGLFRLAGHTKRQQHTPHEIPAYRMSFRNVAIAFQSHKPIALTPEHLRPRANTQPAETYAHKRLTKIWAKMQAEHVEWSYLLVIADLMTTSRQMREEFAPP
jgi:hypothetical protein